MNLEQAKAKLVDISRSTATKHPKVLVSELCSVIHFLLGEIDKIKSPTVSVLSKRLPEDLQLDPMKPIGPPPPPPLPPPPILDPIPHRSPPIADPIRRYRKGNAGDAE